MRTPTLRPRLALAALGVALLGHLTGALAAGPADLVLLGADGEARPLHQALELMRRHGTAVTLAGEGTGDGEAASLAVLSGGDPRLLEEVAASLQRERRVVVLRGSGGAADELASALEGSGDGGGLLPGLEGRAGLLVPVDLRQGTEALASTLERLVATERASVQMPWEIYAFGKKTKAKQEKEKEADDDAPAAQPGGESEVHSLVLGYMTDKYQQHTKMWLSGVKCDWKPSVREVTPLGDEGLYEVDAQWTVLLPAAHDYGTYAPKDSNCKWIRGKFRVDLAARKVKARGKAKLLEVKDAEAER